jgi:integrase
MPRTSNLPKYRKHKHSGQAVVTLSGVDHYLGPHGTQASVREYDRVVQEWLSRGRTNQQELESFTITELIAAYAKFAPGHYRKHGRSTGVWETQQKPLLKMFRAMYGDLPVVTFGPLRLKAFRDHLCKEREIRHGDRVEVKKATRGHVNQQIQIVRRVFRWGASEELVPVDVVTALETVSGLQVGRADLPESKGVRPVSDEDVDATIRFLPSAVASMVRLQLLTGMRPNEVLQLRPCDVERSDEIWTYKPAQHKTEHHGRQRTVALGPQAQEVLLPFLERQPERYCFVPLESYNESRAKRSAKRVTPLSCGNRPGTNFKEQREVTPSDGCYTNDSYRRAIHRAADKAKIARWSPNQLRHSAATKIRAKFGIEQARVVLGHASAVTSEIYAEVDQKAAAEIAKQLG